MFVNLNTVTGRFDAKSVHHILYPLANTAVIDHELEERMLLAQQVCSLVLSLRKKENLKVRQPLQKILIPVLNAGMQTQLQQVEDLIKAEVNIKEIAYLTETEGFIKKKVKPNFARLGKKLGTQMKAVSQAFTTFTGQQISDLEARGYTTIATGSDSIKILLEEVEILAEDIPGWSVASAGGVTVALDITLTEPLVQEGIAREFVNRLQNIRKEIGLQVTDRIAVSFTGPHEYKTALDIFKQYICAEILADNLHYVTEIKNGTAIELNEITMQVQVLKTGI